MKYKIIVDKQSRTNPSDEKREYEIDIEELRYKGDIHDSLIITKDEDYVMRRLELTQYFVLKELEEPIKEPLPDVNIELFEGDNYIYLVDMVGNRFYAEYLIKNDFNDIYATRNEMRSSINQSADQIKLSVNQKLESYATNDKLEEEVTELSSTITQTASEINTEVSKKVGKNEIISKINQTAEEITIDANRININGTVSANGNFKVDKNGNMQAKNGSFTGGNIELLGDADNPTFNIYKNSSKSVNERLYATSNFLVLRDGQYKYINFQADGSRPGISIQNSSSNSINLNVSNSGLCSLSLVGSGGETYINNTGITTPTLTQTSQEKDKKNFEKIENGLDIIKNTDIYKYNLKSQTDGDKKHIGFVIGDNYKYSEEITSKNNDGVDLYSMIAVSYKAIQEQQDIIENQQETINELLARVEKLEAINSEQN